MEILALCPVLYTNDLLKSLNFYTRILSFKTVDFQEENNWVLLEHQSIQILLSAPPNSLKLNPIQFSGSFYFRCKSIQAIWELLPSDCEIVYPIEAMPYGMLEFAIRDNNGYCLQFGEALED